MKTKRPPRLRFSNRSSMRWGVFQLRYPHVFGRVSSAITSVIVDVIIIIIIIIIWITLLMMLMIISFTKLFRRFPPSR